MFEEFIKNPDKADFFEEKETVGKINRRDFLKKSLAVAGEFFLATRGLSDAEAAPGIEIKINGSDAEIGYDENRIKIYRRDKKIVYQIIKKRRDIGVPIPAKEIIFHNKSDLLLKFSPILDNVFGSRRPSMNKEISQIFDTFYNSGESQIDKNVEIIDSNNAKINNIYGNQGIILKKTPGSIGVEVSSGARKRVLYFSNEQDLSIKVGDWLNENIATARSGRKNIREEIEYIYKKLDLSQNIGRKEARDGQEASQGKTLLELDYGTYTLDSRSSNPPATNLLVKNRNTGSLYCLSFVQAAFDMIYGSGSARKIGLYGKKWAQDLRFENEINYDSSKHKNLPKGTVVRFNGLGHIGISLGGDKVAHLIGDDFFIDHLDNITSLGYQPARIIISRESPEVKEIKISKINSGKGSLGKLEKGRNIENIAYRVQRAISSPNKEKNLNYIEETIFQLNKGKFKVVHGHGNTATVVVLKDNYSSIDIPNEWFNSR